MGLSVVRGLRALSNIFINFDKYDIQIKIDDPNCLCCIKRLGNILLRIYCEYFRPQDRIKHLFNCEKKKHLCHLDKYRRSQFRAGDIYGPHISEDKVGLSLNSPNTILSPLYLTSDQTFHLEE